LEVEEGSQDALRDLVLMLCCIALYRTVVCCHSTA